MKESLKKFGISMNIFKKIVKAKLIYSTLIDLTRDGVYVSPQEIKEEKIAIQAANKQRRYRLYEIFLRIDDKKDREKVRENVQNIKKLLENGYSFEILSENISQGNYQEIVGDLGWVCEKNLDRKTKEELDKLSVGQCTGIIETKNGFKILYLADKAEPNQEGQNKRQYKFLLVQLMEEDKFAMASDIRKMHNKIKKIKVATTPDEFKKLCKEQNIPVNILEGNAMDLNTEILNKAELNCPLVVSLNETGTNIHVYFLVSKTDPKIADPSNEELYNIVRSKKVFKEFNKNFKKILASSFVKIHYDKVKEIIR
jgi:hypothetical protein